MRNSQILCLAGKNEIAAECLVLSVAQFGEKDILFLPSDSDGHTPKWQPSARIVAESLNVELVGDIESLHAIPNLVFISLEYDRIIRTQNFSSENLFNIHFSSLPKYRGVYTSFLPIRDREEFTGVTLHKIDRGIDTGPVIDQINFAIPPRTRAHELYLLYTRFGVELFKKNLEALLLGEIELKDQDHLNATSFTRRDIDLKTTELSLDDYSQNIVARFHALTFPIFQYPTFRGRVVKYAETCLSRSLDVGQIAYISNDALRVGTRDSDILLVLENFSSLSPKN